MWCPPKRSKNLQGYAPSPFHVLCRLLPVMCGTQRLVVTLGVLTAAFERNDVVDYSRRRITSFFFAQNTQRIGHQEWSSLHSLTYAVSPVTVREYILSVSKLRPYHQPCSFFGSLHQGQNPTIMDEVVAQEHLRARELPHSFLSLTLPIAADYKVEQTVYKGI